MAKKKAAKDNDDNFFKDLAEETGTKILEGHGKSKYFIDTGNLAVNYINSGRFFGGGIPTGITEIYGPPASSKSLLGYTIAGQCQKKGGIAIILDCERAANEDFAISAGHVNEKQLIIAVPNHIGEVEEKIVSLTKKIRSAKGKDVPIVFIWDSISVTMCQREFRELELPPNYTQAQFKAIVGGKEQPGERAKAAGGLLRKLNTFINENDVTLVIINQIRNKIGVQWGSPETTAGGGMALPFYANCRMRTGAPKQIDDKSKGITVGVNLKFQNKKSRSFVPFMGVEGVQLYFDKGINPVGGLLATLKAAGRIEMAGKGYYKVCEPWAKGQDIKFQASMVKNEVPLDALYKCPSLIDAENEEQIKNYLGVFADAISLSQSDLIEDKDMQDDNDFNFDNVTDVAEDLGIESVEE